MRGRAVTVLRAATVADAGLLAAIHAPVFPEEPWPAAAMAALLESTGTGGLIAEDGGAALGFVLWRTVADEAEILTLAVLPDARRAGVGAGLLGGALALAAGAGASTMFLEVAEDNPAALALYRGAGFAAVGRRPGYYHRSGGVAVAAQVLSRALAEWRADLLK